MRKITKIFTISTLLLLLCISLTSCSFNPFSVSGKTYVYKNVSYELDEYGELQVEQKYDGDEGSFIDDYVIKNYGHVVFTFEIDGTGYYVRSDEVPFVWEETSDSVLIIEDRSGMTIEFKKNFFDIVICHESSILFEKLEIVYSPRLF